MHIRSEKFSLSGDLNERFGSLGFPYWNEGGSPCWDNENVYRVTPEIHSRMTHAVRQLSHIVSRAIEYCCSHPDIMRAMHIPEHIIPKIIHSWNVDRDTTLMGRFDLIVTPSGDIKAMEFNADTPTTFIETAVVQPAVLSQFSGRETGLNGQKMEPYLLSEFGKLRHRLPGVLHLTTQKSATEDWCHIQLYEKLARKAGFVTKLIDVSDIGIRDNDGVFVDLQEQEIRNLYKLYPWEFIMEDDFGDYLLESSVKCIEPLWKYLASHKGLFAVMWYLFPDHVNLLRTHIYDGDTAMDSFVLKPMIGREGQNVTIVKNGNVEAQTEGTYDGGMIIQEYAPLPKVGERNVVIGGWSIDGEAAGFLVRTDTGIVMRNHSMSCALMTE